MGLLVLTHRSRWVGRARALACLGVVLLAGAVVIPREQGGSRRDSWNTSLGRIFLPELTAAEATADTTGIQTTAAVTNSIDSIRWQAWSRQMVADAQAVGRPILVEFTADWCETAKMNEQTSLEVSAVRARLRELNVATLRADWTIANGAIIEAELKSHGRAGLPLTLVYSADPTTAPQILPEVLSESIVLEALVQLEHGQDFGAHQTNLALTASGTPSAQAPILQVSIVLFQAKALYAAGKLTEAKSRLAAVLKDDPKNEAARHYWSLVEKAHATAFEPTLFEPAELHIRTFKLGVAALSQAKALYEAGKLMEAKNRLAAVLKDDPRNSAARHYLTLVEMAQATAFDPMLIDPTQLIRTRTFTLDVAHFLQDFEEISSIEVPASPAGIPTRTRHEGVGNSMDYVIPPNGIPFRVLGSGLGSDHVKVITSSDRVVMKARAFFAKAGVDVTSLGRQIFLNDRLGMLYVRATTKELDIIEQALTVWLIDAPGKPLQRAE